VAKKKAAVEKAIDEALAHRASDVVSDKALMETLKKFDMPYKSKGDPKYKRKDGIFLKEESRGRPKGEMDYFDCPFSNDVDFEDFSKEFLIKLLKLWMNWYISMAMIWWVKVGDIIGKKAADKLLPEVWEALAKDGMEPFVQMLGPKYKTVADIKTLEEGLKASLLVPDGALNKNLWDGHTIWKGPDRVITCVTHCVMMEFYEGIDSVESCKELCEVAEVRGGEAYFIHPNIKVTALKMPPRKSPDEPFCVWEYRMMDKPQPRGPGRREKAPS